MLKNFSLSYSVSPYSYLSKIKIMDNKDTHIDSRHLARLLAVQYLFTQLKSEKDNFSYEPFEPNTILQMLEEKKYNVRLYEEIIDGVNKHKNNIDKVIAEIAPAWPIDQINPLNLVILRCAIWEAFLAQKTPPKVVINEAIELDKVFSTEENSGFINGVLGNIYNNEEVKNKLAKLKD